MRCLETRQTPDGFKRRRYEENGQRFTTYEIPAEVLRHIGMKNARRAMESHRRAKVVRSSQKFVRDFIAANMDWKCEALAHHLQVSESWVNRIKGKILEDSKP